MTNKQVTGRYSGRLLEILGRKVRGSWEVCGNQLCRGGKEFGHHGNLVGLQNLNWEGVRFVKEGLNTI